MKSLVIRAIELLELAQLGSALIIPLCSGQFLQSTVCRKNTKRGSVRMGGIKMDRAVVQKKKN